MWKIRKRIFYGTSRPSKRELTVHGTSRPRGVNKNAMALLGQSRPGGVNKNVKAFRNQKQKQKRK